MHKSSAPGGPQQSDTKKRRLASLEQTLGASSRTSAPQTPAGTGARQPSTRPASRQQQAQTPGSSCPDVKPGDPPYNKLPDHLWQGPLGVALKAPVGARASSQAGSKPVAGSTAQDPLDLVVERFLATNPGRISAELKAAAGLRVQDKSILLDNPTAKLAAAQSQRRSQSNYSSKLVSAKQLKQMTELQPGSIRYDQLLPLHQLWQSYIRGLVPTAGTPFEKLVLESDLHGCQLSISHSKSPHLIGVTGIVAKVSTKAFHIVDQQDRIHVAPKHLCVFRMQAGGRQVVLAGPQMVHHL